MENSAKRYRGAEAFDVEQNPVPDSLKTVLPLIANSFYNHEMRNLHLMDTSETRLYGFMTTYESDNFCWIQPTRTMSRNVEVQYHEYVKKMNSTARQGKLEHFFDSEIKLGLDCIAKYEADNNWYRAIVVEEPSTRDSAVLSWRVIFIDYGNFQYCENNQIAKILPGHFHPPMQAVCCRLYNILPKLPQNRVQIDLKLEQFYVKHSFSFLEVVVKNRRQDFICDVDLFLCKAGTISDRRFFGRHVGQELVESNIAIFADPVAAHVTLPNDHADTQDDPNDLFETEDEDYKRRIKVRNQIHKDVKVKLEQKPTVFKWIDLSRSSQEEEYRSTSRKRPAEASQEPIVEQVINPSSRFEMAKVVVDRSKFRPFG